MPILIILNFTTIIAIMMSAIFAPTNQIVGNRAAFLLSSPPVLESAVSNSPITAVLRGVDNSDNEEGFYLYDKAGTLRAVLPANDTANFEYTLPGLEPDTDYEFGLSSFNAAGESAKSANLPVCTLASSVTGLRASGRTISWNSAGTLTRYQGEYRLVNADGTPAGDYIPLFGSDYAGATGNLSYDFAGMLPDKIYQFRVTTWNHQGVRNPEGSLVTASLNFMAPLVDRIRISVGGQPGSTFRGGYVGSEVLVHLQELNAHGVITSFSANFTEITSGRTYNWTSSAQALAITSDGYVTVPVNLPKGEYRAEFIATNNAGMTGTLSINFKKENVCRVVDRIVLGMGQGGIGYAQVAAAGASDAVTLAYQLTKDPEKQVVIRILDISGQTLFNRAVPTGLEGAHVGQNMVPWNGINLSGDKTSRGLKLIQVEVDGNLKDYGGTGALIFR